MRYSEVHRHWYQYRLLINHLVKCLPGFDEPRLSKYNYVFTFIDEDGTFKTFIAENCLVGIPIEFSYDDALYIMKSLHGEQLKLSVRQGNDQYVIDVRCESPDYSQITKFDNIYISRSTLLPIFI